MSKIVVGIAGGTGSGKTTVAKKILQAFDKNAVILSHDYYYKEYPTCPSRKNENSTTTTPTAWIQTCLYST